MPLAVEPDHPVEAGTAEKEEVQRIAQFVKAFSHSVVIAVFASSVTLKEMFSLFFEVASHESWCNRSIIDSLVECDNVWVNVTDKRSLRCNIKQYDP